MNLKEFAAAVVLTGAVLLNQQEARAQDLHENLNDTEWNHRTPESQKEWEQFFYKQDTLELPEGLSHKEYIEWFKENEAKILKFYNYADSVLTNIPYHIEQKNKIMESYYNHEVKNSTNADHYVNRTVINLMDALYFDGGNEEKVNKYNDQLGKPRKTKGSSIIDDFARSAKKKNNISFFSFEGKYYLIPGVSLAIKSDQPGVENKELTITSHEGRRMHGQGSPTIVLKNSSFVNRSDRHEKTYLRDISEYENLFDKKLNIDNLWLGIGAQELGHLINENKVNDITELQSDWLTFAANKEAGELNTFGRIKDFYTTYKYDKDLTSGMGSPHYHDIYDFMKSCFTEEGLKEIKESRDREERSKNKTYHIESIIGLAEKSANNFVEWN